MKVIGDPNVFAIHVEWDRDPSLYKPWMYGTFCLYLCGERLGVPTNQVTLNSILAGLDGWKEGLAHNRRYYPDLMTTDPLLTFLSIENDIYGLDHLSAMIPSGFEPLPMPERKWFQILSFDGVDDYNIYCIEDDLVSRILYRHDDGPVRECRVPRALLTDVLLRTTDQLDEWFSQLPEPPAL